MLKAISFFIFFSIISVYGYSQSYYSLIYQADSLYQAKNYTQSWKAYKQAFKIKEPNAKDSYNAACSAALAGDNKDAFIYLNRSIDKGSWNINHFKMDPDLLSLHNLREWKILLHRFQHIINQREKGYNKTLSAELLTIFDMDQSPRRSYIDSAQKYGYNSPKLDSLGNVILYNDSINVRKVTNILDKYGWIGRNKVGPQGNTTLFLVIQHADLEIQKKYLPMMEKAVKAGNADASQLALLEDRIALREGKKQIYGSQIGTDSVTGKNYVLPLEDPINVDKRRKAVGLEPLKYYLKNWHIAWNADEYQKSKYSHFPVQ